MSNRNEMHITVLSGLNADGFNVEVKNGNETVFKEQYRYGYNADYSRMFKHHPYVTDIILEIAARYNIVPADISVKSGINVFNNGAVDAENFYNKYIREECGC